MTRSSRIAFLEKKREITRQDLLMKFEDGDYHGVADAAMDLRDIEHELAGLTFGEADTEPVMSPGTPTVVRG